jgi:hypothetical protein
LESRRSRLDEQTTEWLFYTARTAFLMRSTQQNDAFDRLRLVVQRGAPEWMLKEASWLLSSTIMSGQTLFNRDSPRCYALYESIRHRTFIANANDSVWSIADIGYRLRTYVFLYTPLVFCNASQIGFTVRYLLMI